MRLVAVSIVKNEADIIEAFVRHTRAWVDHHLVFDHDSTDGTRKILGALQKEGLPVSLFTDDALGNLQQVRSNELARLAVTRFGADWVVPLDADEILTGPGRAHLETHLSAAVSDRPVSLHLVDYCPTLEDDAHEANPILRLRHRQKSASPTKKVIISAALVRDARTLTGKGSHVVHQDGTALPDQPLPAEFHLSHLALRSPQHQALRVVLAEIQKNSRGQAHAGLDTHYRLGYQTLAEDPDFFFSTLLRPAAKLRFEPIPYLGAPLRYSQCTSGWGRVARALLPFLDKLAASHGALGDGQSVAQQDVSLVRELSAAEIPPIENSHASRYAGFTPIDGWGPREGPVPEAFLPAFHWGQGPATRLALTSPEGGGAHLVIDFLTYSEQQTVAIELNGTTIARHGFVRVNQRERIHLPLQLRTGANELVLRYSQALVTERDPRQLAAIFLRLRVTGAVSP
jgi:hypothetical protein